MSSFIRSVEAGMRVGGALGERYAENKFRKQAAGIEADYLAGKIKDDQLDRLLQDLAVETGTHRRGLTIGGDTSGALREKRTAAFNRTAAGAAAEGRYSDGYAAAGQARALQGDLEGATMARNAQQTAAAYREGPDGTPLIDQQGRASAREFAKSGQIGSASEMRGFSDDQRLQLQNTYAGQLIQYVPAALVTDPETGTVTVDDAAMDALSGTMLGFAQQFDGRTARVSYSPSQDGFHVLDAEENSLGFYPAQDVSKAVVAAGGDPTKLVETIRGLNAADAAADGESVRKRGELNAKFLRDGLLELYKGDSAKAQLVTAAATAAQAAGVDVGEMKPMDDGSYAVTIAGQMLELTPNPNPTLENPQEWTLVNQNGVAVDPAVLQSKQAQAAIAYATATAQANADLSAEDRIAKVQELFQLYNTLEGNAGGGGGSAAPRTGAPIAAMGVQFDDPAAAAKAATPFILGLETSSGMSDDVKNPNSSATGRGQFLDRTWLQMVRRHRPDLARGATDADLLAKRSDPELSTQMTEKYAEVNARALANDGVPLTAETLYLAHHFGAQGAARLLRAGDDTPIENVVSASVIAANPTYRGLTIGQVRDGFMERMERVASSGGAVPRWGGGSSPTSRGGARRPAQGALAARTPTVPDSAAGRAGARTRELATEGLGVLIRGASQTPGVQRAAAVARGADASWDAVTDFLTGAQAPPR